VKLPALAIYAFANPNAPLPTRYDANDQELMASLAESARIMDALKRENIELFRRGVEKGQVLEMQNASHYIFQSNPREVLEAIEKFAADLQSPVSLQGERMHPAVEIRGVDDAVANHR
jgi:hypothetical protein